MSGRVQPPAGLRPPDRVQPPDWVADAVFYQIFPDRFANGDPANDPAGTRLWSDLPTRDSFFGGDLDGILDHLDHLADLGVTAIYLNPIFRAGTNHRYDTWDYLEVDPMLGGTPALERLVAQVHGRGMRVILDGVFNHCGEGFGPFVDFLARGADSAFRDWFSARSLPATRSPLTYMTCGGAPYLPKLNFGTRAVRDFVLQVGRHWIETVGIDGWRLDVPFKIPLDFWAEFRSVVKSLRPDAYLVGEVWRDPTHWIRGDAFDGTTNYRMRELVLDYCADEILDAEDFGFETSLLLASCGPAAGGMLNLLGSHDTTRILTRLKGDVARLRIALTFLFTIPGAPMIYYGDEVGLLGETDPDCRRPMPWSASDWNTAVLEIHRRLIALRHAHPAARHGSIEVLAAFNGVLAYRRSWGEDELIVILNPRDAVPAFDIPTHSARPAWRDVFSGELCRSVDGVVRLPVIPARGAFVLESA